MTYYNTKEGCDPWAGGRRVPILRRKKRKETFDEEKVSRNNPTFSK